MDFLAPFVSNISAGVTPDDGFALIPSGSFSSFYIQQTETTKAQWDVVRTWAVNNGMQ